MNSKFLPRWSYNKWTKQSCKLYYLKEAKFLRTKRTTICLNGSGKFSRSNKDKWDNLNEENISSSDIKEKWKSQTIHDETTNACPSDKKGNASYTQMQKKYEEMKKKIYQKYNHQGIESDPQNVEMHGRNYGHVNELNIHRMLLLGLANVNIHELNKMQINSFLTIQQGKDVLINYPVGSGKTIAYLLPLLNNIYFVHDYLEELILENYNKDHNNNSLMTNSIKKNYKFSNNFDLYNEMRKYFIKYSHYKNHVLLEDNTIQMKKKMKQKFNLLPQHFTELGEYQSSVLLHSPIGRKCHTKKKAEKKKKKNSSNENQNEHEEVTHNEKQNAALEIQTKSNNISLMNKLIEVIKINNINLNNLNSDHINKEEVTKLENLLKYNFKEERKQSNCILTTQDRHEPIYRYLTRNPLQINKSIIILTINKDNISQIVKVIKELDILNRINIQTLNDVPYYDIHHLENEISEQETKSNRKEKIDEKKFHDRKNYNFENIHVTNINRVNNPILCKDEIMWTCADIVITTPDIFLQTYQNEKNKHILPSIIIFDEIDMLFQNNAYRNTMMNIFHIIKKRPQIYNPHVQISNDTIENVDKSIQDVLTNETMEQHQNDHSKVPFFGKCLVLNSFQGEIYSTSSYSSLEKSANLDMTLVESSSKNPPKNTTPKMENKRNITTKEKIQDLPLLQMIYVSSTLPSVGHTTSGSMLTERFSNLVEIVSKENYQIPENVQTQWIELNKDKILSHYLLTNGGESNKNWDTKDEKSSVHYDGINLKDASMSSKINELENCSFEHRLDLLIHVLKKYYERDGNEEIYERSEYSDHDQSQAKKEKSVTTEEGKKKKKKKKFAESSKGKNFHLIDKKCIFKTIIFVNSIKDCIRIYFFLKKHNWPIFCFHKNISINSRIQNLHNFYHTHLAILVTTDLLSRGIDTKNVDHIINFHFPSDAITYLHRLGKMNRYGNQHYKEKPNKGEVQTEYSYQESTISKQITNQCPDVNKTYLVTNFISFSNLPLANSIRYFHKHNMSLLPLFSRKKSFKMKNKRKENTNETHNRYIDVGSLEDEQFNIEGRHHHNLSPEQRKPQHTSNQEEVHLTNYHTNKHSFPCENDEKNVYVQAPVSVFSIDNSDDELEDDQLEDDQLEDDQLEDDQLVGNQDECTNIHEEDQMGSSNYHDYVTTRQLELTKITMGRKGTNGVKCNPHADGNHSDEVTNGDTITCEEETFLPRNEKSKLYKYSCMNNQIHEKKIPSWDDVKFDHKKFLVERFKSKECYLVGQVKRGKLILNNFETKGTDDEDFLF
ncbi:DEAD/DEAH box helicase [Plasmodium gonderi]|uniref:DEAD/DEAH box helicase n=1 Tax=Plasmodium gonderi TaxID=77519 RepID=A0A1Y1JLC2_PLAGO|nr:DEAD/DEAH box helicase [Plasmodium gonderi]GAW80844.1 DEAD/DEAH box helicase [Plasmodium gonderi]